VAVAVAALAPHLPRYQRSMANYARLLLDRDDRQPTIATLCAQWEHYQSLLIDALAPLTAQQLALRAAPGMTRASQLTGESTGACSFHLRQLAKYGFVESAEGGHGRERPWKRSYRSHRWKPSQAEPEMSAAVAALNSVVLQRHFDSASAFLRAADAEPAEWRDAALFSDSLQHLTAGELAQLRDDLLALAESKWR
jgi:hypothetical protein